MLRSMVGLCSSTGPRGWGPSPGLVRLRSKLPPAAPSFSIVLCLLFFKQILLTFPDKFLPDFRRTCFSFGDRVVSVCVVRSS